MLLSPCIMLPLRACVVSLHACVRFCQLASCLLLRMLLLWVEVVMLLLVIFKARFLPLDLFKSVSLYL